jgi:hypothetical protein
MKIAKPQRTGEPGRPYERDLPEGDLPPGPTGEGGTVTDIRKSLAYLNGQSG